MIKGHEFDINTVSFCIDNVSSIICRPNVQRLLCINCYKFNILAV